MCQHSDQALEAANRPNISAYISTYVNFPISLPLVTYETHLTVSTVSKGHHYCVLHLQYFRAHQYFQKINASIKLTLCKGVYKEAFLETIRIFKNMRLYTMPVSSYFSLVVLDLYTSYTHRFYHKASTKIPLQQKQHQHTKLHHHALLTSHRWRSVEQYGQRTYEYR